MKLISEYIYTLCVCLVLSSAVFAAVPESTLKATFKTAVGIVIALIAVSAFARVPELQIPYSRGDEVIEYGAENENMEELIIEQTKKLSENKISNQVGGKKVRITLEDSGNIEKVEIENVTKADKILVSRNNKIEIEKITGLNE